MCYAVMQYAARSVTSDLHMQPTLRAAEVSRRDYISSSVLDAACFALVEDEVCRNAEQSLVTMLSACQDAAWTNINLATHHTAAVPCFLLV